MAWVVVGSIHSGFVNAGGELQFHFSVEHLTQPQRVESFSSCHLRVAIGIFFEPVRYLLRGIMSTHSAGKMNLALVKSLLIQTVARRL